MESFTPVSSYIGGLLIGLSASIFLLMNGRVTGVSGILGGMFNRPLKANVWRIIFILGLIVGAFIYQLMINPSLSVTRTGYPAWLLIIGGLLVGFGTRMGNGCTSGHGICGIARLSKRSIIATVSFMFFGMLTATLIHLVGN